MTSRNDPPEMSSEQALAIHRLQQVERLSRAELDELPFGVIQVDLEGGILAYNAAEATLAGLDASEVIGRNFFTDVAPCTNVEEFGERFRLGIARGHLHESFPFRFSFSKSPVHVMISMHHERPNPHAWIFVNFDRDA